MAVAKWMDSEVTSTGDILGVSMSEDQTEITIMFVNSDPGEREELCLLVPAEDWRIIGKFFFAVNKVLNQNISRRGMETE